MDTILLVIISMYFLEHLVYFFGMLRNFNSQKVDFDESNYPSVSVIVSARNEEKNISMCIESLLKIEYPRENLEIIVINDRSTDKTGEVVKSYSQKYPEIIYLETEDLSNRLKGKTGALNQAIKKSKGEIIFTTDADCEVKPTWVKEMVRYYDENTGVVNSYTIIKPENIYSGFQSYDWLYLLTIASGADGINNQLSCVGNNMSYRRKAYEEVGGYEKVKFSVTEDFMLLKTIRDTTKWQVKFPVDEKILNYTLPCGDFKELYRQKKRWGRGGLDIRFTGFIVGLIGWSAGTAMLGGWVLGCLTGYLLYVISKILIDILFVIPAVHKFNSYKVLFYIIPFELYFAVYAFVLPFILLFDRTVVWKEQKL
jgi:cellulose synthase/poly-beta-1,6-N-acetylglucosamine synthase-like glycosyltransferase